MKTIPMIIWTACILLSCNNSKELGKVASGSELNYYIDTHYLGKGNVTARAVAEAHAKDLATEGKYGVHFVHYWIDEDEGTVYCLSKSPSKNLIIQTHREAHGLIPQEVKQVVAGGDLYATGKTKIYLDIHTLGKGHVTAKEVADAHKKDLLVQDKYNVRFLNYWVDEMEGVVYCLSESNSPDDIISTHAEAHGLVPQKVLQVLQGD